MIKNVRQNDSQSSGKKETMIQEVAQGACSFGPRICAQASDEPGSGNCRQPIYEGDTKTVLISMALCPESPTCKRSSTGW